MGAMCAQAIHFYSNKPGLTQPLIEVESPDTDSERRAVQLNFAITSLLHISIALEDPFDPQVLDGVFVDEALLEAKLVRALSMLHISQIQSIGRPYPATPSELQGLDEALEGTKPVGASRWEERRACALQGQSLRSRRAHADSLLALNRL